jgi:hypothetical protein
MGDQLITKRIKVGLAAAVFSLPLLVGTTQATASTTSCSSSGSVCFYQDNDFNGYYGEHVDTGGCGFYYNVNSGWLGVSSIRNRTNRTVRLRNGYNGTGSYIDIAANTEVARLGYTYGPGWNDAMRSYDFPC